MSQARATPFLELPDTLRRFSHEELLEGSESMSPARLLGKGGFGPVYLAQDRRSGRNLAIKVGTGVADAGVGQGRNEFENEALLLWLWQHERIVRLEGVSIGPTPCLVYEHMAGGSLASLICNPARAAAFSATQRLTVAADVAHALAFLHEGGCGANPPENPRVRHAVVLHRDVNSHNVLLDGDLRGKVFCPCDSLSLSLSLSHTHTHTCSRVCCPPPLSHTLPSALPCSLPLPATPPQPHATQLGDFGLCAMVHQADVHAGMVLRQKFSKVFSIQMSREHTH